VVGTTPVAADALRNQAGAGCAAAPPPSPRPHACAHAHATLENSTRAVDESCLACHVTGFRTEGGFIDVAATPDLVHVGCESCHGGARDHLRNNLARYGKVEIDTCLSCHDVANSPDFDYYTYLPRVTHGGRASR